MNHVNFSDIVVQQQFFLFFFFRVPKMTWKTEFYTQGQKRVEKNCTIGGAGEYSHIDDDSEPKHNSRAASFVAVNSETNSRKGS